MRPEETQTHPLKSALTIEAGVDAVLHAVHDVEGLDLDSAGEHRALQGAAARRGLVGVHGGLQAVVHGVGVQAQDLACSTSRV
jgi:hypothetical protein